MRSLGFLVIAMPVLVAISTPAATARGDTIWLGGAAGGGEGTGATEMGAVQITEVRDGRLLFVAGGGRAGAREIDQIARIAADSEPALNAAEAALAEGRLDAAIDGFRKAMAASAKSWVRYWSAHRLASIAPRAKRFDAAASGYIALLVLDPARAAAVKPPLPPAQSTFLISAAAEANAALTAPGLSPASRQALETFIGELQQAQAGGAAASAAAIVDAAAPVQPSAPSAQRASGAGAVAVAAHAAAADAANQQAAREKLAAAHAALERKDYSGAINEIRANARVFTDPRDQAQALYFIAEAQTGLALAKNDVPAWQDAALAYMRVVAHFQDGPPPARAFAARAMLKAAQIHETIRDRAAARALYEQLTKEFAGDPAAADAKAALERLKATP